MPTDDDFFTPEDVDEQIDSLSHAYGHIPEAAQPAEHIVSHLHQYYNKNAQEQHNPLDSAWKRIVAGHQAAQQTSQRKGRLIVMPNSQDESQSTPAQRKKRTLTQRLGVLAAVLFVCLLVGGMALVLNAGRQNHSTPKPVVQTGSGGGTPVPPPPHPITGGACSIDTTHPHQQESKVNLPGLYIFAMNQQSDNLLYRYDPQTQKVVWSIKLCQNFYANGGETFEQNGILYFQGTDWTNTAKGGSVSYLYALNEADGSAIWGIQFPTANKTFGPAPTPGRVGTPGVTDTPEPNAGSSPADLGMIEAPTFANGVVYVVQRSGVVYAYNATTGSALWTFDSGRTAWATTKDGNGSILDPSSVQVVNGTAYFSIVDRMYALNAQSGKQLWVHSFDNAQDIMGEALDNGTLYLTAFVPGYGSVANPDTYVYAFDAQTGAQKWVTKKLVGYITGPVASNGSVHAMSYDGVWYTFDPSTGTVTEQKALPGASGIISLELIDGVLYRVSNTGMLIMLNPDGSAQWSVQTSGHQAIQDVQNGVIYISGPGTGVSAYSATNGKFLWHYAGYRPQPQGDLSVTVVP
jgi:outer membrane protein assembly factor BamB